MKRAVIFVNGNLSNFSQAKNIITYQDTLIAVDGGVRHILKLGLTPHVVIGDLDSISSDLLGQSRLSPTTTLIKYPHKKDKTDFELAVNFALGKKYNQIIIFGILGDRVDHFLANIFLLTKIQIENRTIKIKIIDGKKEIYILNKEIIIDANIGDEISIIPVSAQLQGVTTDGLEYRLNNETLFFGTTRGISNVMNKKTAKITTTKGVALVEHNYFNS